MEATRKAMSDRRHEWANQIRKDKRSQLLARKRRFFKSSSGSDEESHTARAATTTSPSTVLELAKAFVASNSPEQLARLQSSLSSSDTARSANAAATILADESLATSLAITLGNILGSEQQAVKDRLVASRLITNLAASSDTNAQEEASYYGRPPPSWPNVLIQCSSVMNGLLQVLQQQQQGTPDMALVQQCCWVVGNLAGDAPHQSLMAFVPHLVQLLQEGLHRFSNTILCRNSVWALSNLARGKSTSSTPFVASGILTTTLVAQILLSPEQRSPPQHDGVSWTEVAYEMAWLVAYLTAKEEETVDYLLSADQDHVSFSSQPPVLICEGIACRLSHAVRQVRHATTLANEETTNALRMSLPLIRAIGNVATSRDGVFLTPLLKAHNESVVKSLASLVEMASFPSSKTHSNIALVATEATWAAGTLLIEAGIDKHVSTVLAVPALMPVLVQCVINSTLPIKREALQALWNAVAAPPQSENEMGKIWATRAARDEYLDDMLKQDERFLVALVDLLTNYDNEVVLWSVQLVNAFLRRRRDESKRLLEEAGVVEALDGICDRASQRNMDYVGPSTWQGSECLEADIAADLLDDVFEEDIGMHDNVENDYMNVAPAQQGDTFAFGIVNNANGGMAFNSAPPSSMGRGRGKPVPAWMSQKQN